MALHLVNRLLLLQRLISEFDPKQPLADTAEIGETGRRASPRNRPRPNDDNVAQCRLARLIASDRTPTKKRLRAQVASRLNQLRDRNLRPK